MGDSKDGNKLLTEPLTYVLFGSTGDLARKKLFPALGALMVNELIPKDVKVICCSRKDLKMEELFEKQAVNLSDEAKKLLLPRCSFFKNKEAGDYKKINEDIEAYVKEKGGPDNRIFFFSLPPFAYESTSELVKSHCYSKSGFTRLILEKPFGKDSESFEKLAKATGKFFSEKELYRIDHYLGKEVVLSLPSIRFGNQIFEPLWNRNYIESVHIEWKEDLNTMGRGGYFDKYGIIRDIMQNHLLQVLVLIGMEKPKSMSEISEAKLALLKSVKTIEMKDVLLGQFIAKKYCHYCKETENPGYREDPTVPNDSKVPTYAMLKLCIDNERWKGVPFLMSAGKALDERKCEVRIRFKPDSNPLFKESNRSNELVIRIQPDESVYFVVNIKKPGLSQSAVPKVLDLSYSQQFRGSSTGDAYERMLLNCAKGEQALFVTTGELIEAWRIFTPLLHTIDSKKPEPVYYPFGDGGPKGYREFAAKNGVKLKETWQEFFLLHAHEQKLLSDLFEKHSHEGSLKMTDIKALVSEFYDGREPTGQMLESFMKAFDENNDGKVSWEEFSRGAHLFVPWTATTRTSSTLEDLSGFSVGPEYE
eukprot:CAMPEP_0184478782 /NCGR_PEP_ID=MMETSP0113_2-20130426/711_1 /TAXON_ID=91329 /ORGANISM="Norrisiella sphaerica, Strain BC52" /LENGTH=589 /DNA_ID=CAMNT_0026856683 /DNA_START=14 /DNA_END=1783 /DNA_ORIENTATION=-